MKDGLSQLNRTELITKLKHPELLDVKFSALLNRAMAIASYMKYFSWDMDRGTVHDGSFDAILDNILSTDQVKNAAMDPSGAVLYNFLENLQQTADLFNTRWKDLPNWYIRDFLGVKPRMLQGDRVWVSFKNAVQSSFTIPAKTGFMVDFDTHTQYYDLMEDTEVHATALRKLYLLNFQKSDHVKKSQTLRAVRLRELQLDHPHIRHMAYEDADIGIRINSPVLVLHEGTRHITITCHVVGLDTSKLDQTDLDIFKISVSTVEGWMRIDEYSFKADHDKLVIHFVLPDNAPPTSPCTYQVHQYVSDYPAVNLVLNLDSSSYQNIALPYFQVSKAVIRVHVKDVTNIKVYNELGQVDNSKPFAPFGINGDKGTWFTIGSHEMSLKNTQKAQVNFYWEQLPDYPNGLADLYAQYGTRITNDSFEVSVRYLSDFQWKIVDGKSEFALFGSENDTHRLRSKTVLGPIDIEKMPPVRVEEEDYDYSLNTRNGFLNFKLIHPDMGFGEAVYRQIFTEQMMKNARKKQKYPTILPPLRPLLKRITLDYEAEDTIDARYFSNGSIGQIHPILPLEQYVMNRPVQNDFVEFVPQLEDHNILMALEQVHAGARLNMFVDLQTCASTAYISVRDLRAKLLHINAYIGNPLHWQMMPLSFVVNDETMAFLLSGCIQFQFPDIIPAHLYDDQGLLWIRIGFENVDPIYFPEIKSVFINAGLLKMRIPQDKDTPVVLNASAGNVVEEMLVPGLGQIQRITGFFGGHLEESAQEMQLRVSAYASHKGRAVTARDYERLVLEAFPEIAKVKCVANSHLDDIGQTTVSIIVLPRPKENNVSFRPTVPSHLLYFIERYVRGLASAYVQEIKVINPIYEEVTIKCRLKQKHYLSLRRKKELKNLINNFIAPWQSTDMLPVIGYEVDLKRMHDDLVSEFGDELIFYDFSAICVEQVEQDFRVKEVFYKKSGHFCLDYHLKPLRPNVIFVPSEEHIVITKEERNRSFGVNEMIIGSSFIVPKK